VPGEPAPIADRGREPEVHHHGAAIRGEHDVGRLQVTVHHAGLVRRVERGRDLEPDASHLGHRERALPAEAIREGLAREVLHGEEEHAAGLAHVEGAGKAEVAHGVGHGHLLAEPLQRQGVLQQVAPQGLDRDLPLQEEVVREQHVPHPAGADGLQQAVAAGDDRALLPATQIGHPFHVQQRPPPGPQAIRGGRPDDRGAGGRLRLGDEDRLR